MSDSFPTENSRPISIIVTTIALAFFVFVFSSVYICRIVHCWINIRRRRETYNTVRNNFPTFTYASVKKLREDKYGLECAICLTEFSDKDVLRLLTICRHVFHKICIDAWIRSNHTCPICRVSLQCPGKSPLNSTLQVGTNGNEQMQDSVIITINREGENESRGVVEGPINWGVKLPKSHSTGYSYLKVKRRHDDGRFKLKFPEHLHSQMTRQHSRTKSYSSFGEFEHPRNGGISSLRDGDHLPRAKTLLQSL